MFRLSEFPGSQERLLLVGQAPSFPPFLQAPPAGSGAVPHSKSNLVHFSFKMCRLVAAVSVIFMRINVPKFNYAVSLQYAVNKKWQGKVYSLSMLFARDKYLDMF